MFEKQSIWFMWAIIPVKNTFSFKEYTNNLFIQVARCFSLFTRAANFCPLADWSWLLRPVTPPSFPVYVLSHLLFRDSFLDIILPSTALVLNFFMLHFQPPKIVFFSFSPLNFYSMFHVLKFTLFKVKISINMYFLSCVQLLEEPVTEALT